MLLLSKNVKSQCDLPHSFFPTLTVMEAKRLGPSLVYTHEGGQDSYVFQ